MLAPAQLGSGSWVGVVVSFGGFWRLSFFFFFLVFFCCCLFLSPLPCFCFLSRSRPLPSFCLLLDPTSSTDMKLVCRQITSFGHLIFKWRSGSSSRTAFGTGLLGSLLLCCGLCMLCSPKGSCFSAFPQVFSELSRDPFVSLPFVKSAQRAMEGRMEARLAQLEDKVAEWDATLRVRVKGCQPLLEEAREIEGGSKEFWRLKEKVGDILLRALTEELTKCPQASNAVPDTWRTELTQVFRAEFLVGVFSVGGKFSSSELVDIRFRPGLQGLRANFLVKDCLTRILKEIPQASFGMWVPLSAPETKRRRKRAASNPAPAEKDRVSRARRGNGGGGGEGARPARR